MSHFAVYVFSEGYQEDVDDLLAPYDERIDYPPYIKYTKEQAIAKVRKEIEDYKNTTFAEYLADPEKYVQEHGDAHPKHIDYLRNVFPKKLWWSDEQCYEDEAHYYEDDMIDENGNLLSTYNPNSKWDWYEIGGRWNDTLITLSCTKTNEDIVDQIDWDKTPVPFAFITPDGKWHERGEMGWWAIVSNEKDNSEWEEEFRDAVKKYHDLTVTVVDCHI